MRINCCGDNINDYDNRKKKRVVAGYFGLQDKYVIKELLNRERTTLYRLEVGIIPHPKRRLKKDALLPVFLNEL